MPAAVAVVCERERVCRGVLFRACVTTPDTRKIARRSKMTCTRPRTCGTHIDTDICVWIVAACCNAAACARYAYIYPWLSRAATYRRVWLQRTDGVASVCAHFHPPGYHRSTREYP